MWYFNVFFIYLFEIDAPVSGGTSGMSIQTHPQAGHQHVNVSEIKQINDKWIIKIKFKRFFSTIIDANCWYSYMVSSSTSSTAIAKSKNFFEFLNLSIYVISISKLL